MAPKRRSRSSARPKGHAEPPADSKQDLEQQLDDSGSAEAAPKKPASKKRKTSIKNLEDHCNDAGDNGQPGKSKEEDNEVKIEKKAATAAQKKGKTAAARKAAAATTKKQALSDDDDDDKTPSAQAPTGPRFYLMKSEPHEFSIDDQAAKPNGTYCWEGVRNAQAKNIMRGMKVGEQIFFYHSSCKVPGIVGLCTVAKEAYPDYTAWDPKSKYHDERSTEDKPKWWMVDVKFVRKTKRMITLEELKQYKDSELAGMVLLNRSRLSVQPVTKEQWDFIMSLEDKDPANDD